MPPDSYIGVTYGRILSSPTGMVTFCYIPFGFIYRIVNAQSGRPVPTINGLVTYVGCFDCSFLTSLPLGGTKDAAAAGGRYRWHPELTNQGGNCKELTLHIAP